MGMDTQVASDQIEFYRENGFLIIDDPSRLKGAELLLWQDAVDAADRAKNFDLPII